MADVGSMLADLSWCPIAEYDREAGEVALFRAKDQDWAIGYWGDRHVYTYADGSTDHPEPVDASPAFRHAQSSIEGAKLDYEPDEFAAIDPDWAARLVEG